MNPFAIFVSVKKLDLYILRKFLVTFFFCLLLLTTIVVVVDISEKTDDFLKSKLTTWQIITDYYSGFVPRTDAMLFPLFVFISVIFFTSKMAGRSEIVAILSSGVTFRRFLRPYLIGSIFLSLMLWGAYQYLIPEANRKWSDFSKKYIDVNSVIASYGQSSYKQNLFFRDDPETYVSIRGYDTISRRGSSIYVNRFRGYNLVYNLRAEEFSWDSARYRWMLNKVAERFISPVNETVRMRDSMQARFHFGPEALKKDNYLKDQLTTPQLNAFIRMERQRGSEMLNSLLVERYNRDAIPFSVIILTMIGAVLASRRQRGGSGVHLALGVAISMVYVLASRVTVVFATKGDFPALLASWLPNILFGLLAWYLYQRAPK